MNRNGPKHTFSNGTKTHAEINRNGLKQTKTYKRTEFKSVITSNAPGANIIFMIINF